jgi:hypothetical protein
VVSPGVAGRGGEDHQVVLHRDGSVSEKHTVSVSYLQHRLILWGQLHSNV